MTMSSSPIIDRLAATPFGPRGVYESLVERVYLPVVDWRKRTGFPDAAREARTNQHLSREAMDAMVLKKLQRILEHAERTVPFYAKRFAEAGVHAPSLRA